jgi:hypothetical protein
MSWLTPVFRPDLLARHRNRGVSPFDFLDAEAAIWAQRHGVRAGADPEELAKLPMERELQITVTAGGASR